MKRQVSLAVLLVAASTLAAGAQSAPAGWKVRVDRSTSAVDPDAAGSIKFMKMGSGFHAVNPQAAVYWTPKDMATGTYTLKGTFTLLEPSNHTNYYGFVFGGHDLDGPAQTYLYFLVAQDGTFLVKKREGERTEYVVRKTPSSAVKTPDASGKSTNVLQVHVMPDKIDYVVNGTTVQSTPRSGLAAGTDGIWGLRVNHFLNVQIDDLSLSK